tara:strand:+ start:367 stop:603 length:237 start_codon:yes stop_codon:yes gene_type:complete
MMKVQKVVIVAVILNLLLPLVVTPYATPAEISPPNGVQKLSLKEQIVHMLVHHGQAPVSSSIVIFVLFMLSFAICARM